MTGETRICANCGEWLAADDELCSTCNGCPECCKCCKCEPVNEMAEQHQAALTRHGREGEMSGERAIRKAMVSAYTIYCCDCGCTGYYQPPRKLPKGWYRSYAGSPDEVVLCAKCREESEQYGR